MTWMSRAVWRGKKAAVGKAELVLSSPGRTGREAAPSPPVTAVCWQSLRPSLSTLGFDPMSSKATSVLFTAVKLMRNVPWMGMGVGLLNGEDKGLSPGCGRRWDGFPLGEGRCGGLPASEGAPGLRCEEKGTNRRRRCKITSLNYPLPI